MGWTVVVPVRGGGRGKSRLPAAVGGVARPRWVLAFAADTIAALRWSAPVEQVVVALSAPFPELTGLAGHRGSGGLVRPGGSRRPAPVSFHLDAAPRGLNAAIVAACAGLGEGPLAVLPGDLPCLRPTDVADLLRVAASLGRVVVPDTDGRGSVALAAVSGGLTPRFGNGSFAAHRAAGYRAAVAGDRLRRDVDTPADLAEALSLGVGGATSALAREAGLLPAAG
ncbi:2-phospho-L-lactate guanylyltransferase [Propionicimonas sp.]|uniref:2-phospho-L-lactate guanylyltransferase n=1 Tax=Propionicimonas sp. TaxID=1955623 RepID=UPI0039E4427C